MTLQRLLACFLGLLSLVALAALIEFAAQIALGQALPGVETVGVIAFQLLVVAALLLQRMRIAGWILGSRGDLPAHDRRGLLAVGAAVVGVWMLVPSLQTLAFLGVFYSLRPMEEELTYVFQLFGIYYLVGALLVVGARWIPMWTGWGRLGSED